MTAVAPAGYDLATLRRAHRLVDVVRGYGVVLRPGGRALVGLCPLHGDRATPNLHVYVDPSGARDNWFCFACMQGGDVVAFVMRREGLGFDAACALLGARPTPPPPRHAPDPIAPPPPAPPRWDRLSLDEQAVMNEALAVYEEGLRRAPHASAYLASRAVPERVARACRLGYSDGRALAPALFQRGALPVAERLGLVRRHRDGRLVEPLAGRVVVPELRGRQCAWLIGRLVPDRPDEAERRPKYLGLAGERPVLGWERVAGKPEAFLVEGVFGYLVGVAWRLPVCATGGTHLPADRLGFLARAARVWGLLDPDEPGRAAAERMAGVLGDRFRPLWLPDRLEIDDLALRPGGRAAFGRCLAAARAAHGDPTKEIHRC